MSDNSRYYVPRESHWPIVGSIGLLLAMVGVSTWLNGSDPAFWVFMSGIAVLVIMLFGWFRCHVTILNRII